jgi:single-strand DNA-binding protein
MSINLTMMVGRLTRDPELKMGRSGVTFANFCLAANRQYKDQAGEKREETAFLPCLIFGKPAEWTGTHKKGEPVAVAGRLRTESWEGDGKQHSRLVLVVESIQFFEHTNSNSGDQPPF